MRRGRPTGSMTRPTGSRAVLLMDSVHSSMRGHLGDCRLRGQSRRVKAGTEVKDKKFFEGGQVSSWSHHLAHLLGWCDARLGIRHEKKKSNKARNYLLSPFLYSLTLTSFQLNYLILSTRGQPCKVSSQQDEDAQRD